MYGFAYLVAGPRQWIGVRIAVEPFEIAVERRVVNPLLLARGDRPDATREDEHQSHSDRGCEQEPRGARRRRSGKVEEQGRNARQGRGDGRNGGRSTVKAATDPVLLFKLVASDLNVELLSRHSTPPPLRSSESIGVSPEDVPAVVDVVVAVVVAGPS